MISFCIFVLAACCCENNFQKQVKKNNGDGASSHMGAWTHFQTTNKNISALVRRVNINFI